MSNQRIRVLLVEDNPTDVVLLHEKLMGRPTAAFEITRVENLATARQHLRQALPDVVLLDPGLPDSQGLATLVALREHAPRMPIIVLTGLDDEALGLHALQVGAQDYLVKGHLTGDDLARSIRYAIEHTRTETENTRLFQLAQAQSAERQRAEATLHESQERLAGIVESTMDAIISIDAAQCIVVFNTAAEQMFGCPAAAALGQPIDRFILTPFRGVHAAHIHAFGQTSVTCRSMHSSGRLTALRANGAEFPIEGTISQTVVAGQPLYTVIMRDISMRTQAEAALRASQERYRQIVETTQEGIWLIDAANTTTFVNAKLADLLGYTIEEMIGASLFDFMDAEDQAISATNIERRQGLAEQFDCKFRHKNGAAVWALISTNPLYDDTGTYVGTLAMLTDITERKRAEQALLAQTARLRVLADASATFAEVGTEYQALLDKIARTTATVLGEGCTIRLLSEDKEWLDLVALYDGNAEKLELTRMVLGKALLRVDEPSLATQIFHSQQPLLIPIVNQAETRATTKPEYWSLVERLGIHSRILVPMQVQGQTIGILSLYRHRREQPPFDADDLMLAQDLADRAALAISNVRLFQQVQAELAERTKAEAAVRVLSADLERRVVVRTAELTAANKELEAFSYSVSHDLRSPLRAIDGFSRILLEDYAATLPDDVQGYFQLIRDNAQQMGRLVDGLLAFAHLGRQTLTWRTVDSARLVRECLDNLHAGQANRAMNIEIGALPICAADPALLKQVWINLITNALKYTRRRDPAEIVIGCQTDGPQPVYFIQDNGVGFDMRYSAKLFGVFQRMHRAEEYEGTGVGLAIVQRIIQRHSGRIWTEAVVGQGATFYFTLGEDPNAREANRDSADRR